MSDTDARQTGFDFNAWKEQGDQALEQLRARKADLENELDSVCEELKQLEIALGKRTADAPEGSKKPKVMVRKVIMEVIIEAGEEGLTLDDIIDKVQERKSQAPASSIETSLSRLAKEHDKIVLEGDRYYFRASGEAAA